MLKNPTLSSPVTFLKIKQKKSPQTTKDEEDSKPEKHKIIIFLKYCLEFLSTIFFSGIILYLALLSCGLTTILSLEWYSFFGLGFLYNIIFEDIPDFINRIKKCQH